MQRATEKIYTCLNWTFTFDFFIFDGGFISVLIYLQQIIVITRIDKHFGSVYTGVTQLVGITKQKTGRGALAPDYQFAATRQPRSKESITISTDNKP